MEINKKIKICELHFNDLIVHRGNYDYGIKAAYRHFTEGIKSRTPEAPIQVTWIQQENKFLITDGMHRLVEAILAGKDSFLCEIDWTGSGLKKARLVREDERIKEIEEVRKLTESRIKSLIKKDLLKNVDAGGNKMNINNIILKEIRSLRKEGFSEVEVASMGGRIVDILQQISEKLNKLDGIEQLDLSMDYLSAAITGRSPLAIDLGQDLKGRSALPGPGGSPLELKQERVGDGPQGPGMGIGHPPTFTAAQTIPLGDAGAPLMNWNQIDDVVKQVKSKVLEVLGFYVNNIGDAYEVLGKIQEDLEERMYDENVESSERQNGSVSNSIMVAEKRSRKPIKVTLGENLKIPLRGRQRRSKRRK